MNWKLIIYVAAGVTAGTVLAKSLVGSVSPLYVALAAAGALVCATLLALMLRIGARKKGTTEAG